MSVNYVITATTPQEAIKCVADWHRIQARLAMSKAQVIAHNTKTRMAYVAEAGFHNNSAEFLETVLVKEPVA